ncbi:MAG: hypothetical protein Q8P69_01845, partial [bacterium]|nr:hypothetical protein [bacterium]
NQEATNSATYADVSFIEAEGAFFSDYLAVLGEATITDLSVTNRLSLTSLFSPTGTIDLAGNLVINGNLTVTGNVNILGELTAPTASFSSLLAQKITAEEIKVGQLIIANPESSIPGESSSATPGMTNSITTNATAGKGIIPDGSTELTINSPHVDAASLIYVTPTGDPQNQVLYVKAKAVGQWFTVAINQPLDHALEFNWWIIKLE